MNLGYEPTWLSKDCCNVGMIDVEASGPFEGIRPPKTLDQARLRDDDLRLHFFARPCTA